MLRYFLNADEISDSAQEFLVDYPGWDTQQLWVLKARAQAAKEGYELLIAKINEAIADGVAEAQRARPLHDRGQTFALRHMRFASAK